MVVDMVSGTNPDSPPPSGRPQMHAGLKHHRVTVRRVGTTDNGGMAGKGANETVAVPLPHSRTAGDRPLELQSNESGEKERENRGVSYSLAEE